MQFNVPLPNRLFAHPSATRILRIDSHWRFVMAQFKAHGGSPDNTPRAPMRGFGANFVLRGSGTYTDQEGRAYPLQPGIFFQRLPGQEHKTWFDPASDYAEFYLTLDPVTSASLRQLGLISPQPLMDVGFSSLLLEDMEHLRATLESTESERTSPSVLVSVITFLNQMYERARTDQSQEGWPGIIRRACQLLERSLDQRISPEAIAEELGVPYSTFRRRFREIAGTSPGEYRVRCRLERACVMLRDLSVQQVASELAYADPFTFSNQFKHFLHLSPRRFQENPEQRDLVPRVVMR